jgi:hypothetical protein
MNTLRYTGILLGFVSVACTHMAPAIHSKVNNTPVRVCKKNLTYRIIDKKLSNKSLKAIRKGIEYWNLHVDEPLFVEVDDFGKPDILIDTSDLNKDNESTRRTSGRTSIFYSNLQKTCVVAALVLLDKSDTYLTFNSDRFQTVVRHEFGHVLGLDDIDDNRNNHCRHPDLMCHVVNNAQVYHPMDAGTEHIARLRTLYPNRAWKERANQWMLDD